jgi:hypothetical protein
MAGPIASGTPLQWPPLGLDDGSDEANAARMVFFLDLDRAGWDDADRLTIEMLEVPAVQRARRAIAGMLYEQGTIAGSELHRIYGEATAPSVSSE